MKEVVVVYCWKQFDNFTGDQVPELIGIFDKSEKEVMNLLAETVRKHSDPSVSEHELSRFITNRFTIEKVPFNKFLEESK